MVRPLFAPGGHNDARVLRRSYHCVQDEHHFRIQQIMKFTALLLCPNCVFFAPLRLCVRFSFWLRFIALGYTKCLLS